MKGVIIKKEGVYGIESYSDKKYCDTSYHSLKPVIKAHAKLLGIPIIADLTDGKNIISFSDGVKYKILTDEQAKVLFLKHDVYRIDIDNEIEGLIETENDLYEAIKREILAIEIKN